MTSNLIKNVSNDLDPSGHECSGVEMTARMINISTSVNFCANIGQFLSSSQNAAGRVQRDEMYLVLDQINI